MKRFLVLVFLLASGRLTGTAWSSDGGVPPALFATDEARFGDAEEEEGSGYRVEPVVVQATRIGSDKNTVAGRELEMMPSATGSITEALKGMSQVQFSNERQSSRTLGEIAPPRISIFGAKPYENNFLIDGMNVTNTLNPSGFDDSAGPNDLMVGGGDSTIFYDTHLVESITVHSSNVPAEFGGFLGGAVDAKLRDPRADRWYFTVSGAIPKMAGSSCAMSTRNRNCPIISRAFPSTRPPSLPKAR
jgi:TonB-dependent Receptor Plug Domain.